MFNKQVVMVISSLLIGSSLQAKEVPKGGYYFSTAFQKRLKKIQPLHRGHFRTLGLNKKNAKKSVYIDWQRLYWGKLSDLIYAEGETEADDDQLAVGTEDQNLLHLNTDDSQGFADELRLELKAFAQSYDLKIVWKQKTTDIPDGTAAFIEYWCKGYSGADNQNEILSFEELSALGAKTVKSQKPISKIKPVGKGA